MPEICRFYGIVIKMFFKPKEHEPSHLHALYGEHIGIFDLKTMKMTEGDLPTRAQQLVQEWMSAHQDRLLEIFCDLGLIKIGTLIKERHEMPEICRFYGIVIKMFFKPKEHEPSHLHALYGEHIGIFDLKTMKMTEGDLPTRAQQLVQEWMSAHQDRLLEMWDTQKLEKLPPL